MREKKLFVASLFFVLGFTLVFSIFGVLLQSVLSIIRYDAQRWLSIIGGIIIILFGVYLLGAFRIPFLERVYKIRIHRNKKHLYLSSALFGAAFAIGWTPCVGPVLGAVLTLALTQPGEAFLLLFAYSIGLGIPFLVVGWFGDRIKGLLPKLGRFLRPIQFLFGIILILLGLFVITNLLSSIANFGALSLLVLDIDDALIGSGVSIGVAFIAGIVSFLSPCIFPLLPAYLAFLGGVGKD